MSNVIFVRKSKDKNDVLSTVLFLQKKGYKGVTYNQDPVDTDVYRILIVSDDNDDLELSLKELQKDKNYDRIVISEELEAFTNTQYTQIDKFIFDKLFQII